MIEWNTGLSLGIDSLDNEHKQLLKITNKLSEALHNNVQKELVNEIFKELIKAIEEHSENEEALLKKCNYKNLNEHSEHHLDFINRVKELKTQCCSSNGTEDVTNDIMDLLLIHIITEDIPLIKTFEKYGLIKQEENGKYLLQQLVKKITNTISFTKRILFSTLIPLMGMLILGFIILQENYYKHMEVKETSTITKILSNINTLAHALQIERGLSSGYISSTTEKFKDELHQHYKVVDKEIKEFNIKLKSVDNNKLKSIQSYLKSFQDDILTLHEYRKKVNNKNISQIEVIKLYTKIIKNILNITSKVSSFNLNTKIDESISSLSYILQYKEALGQSRAYGIAIIEQNSSSSVEYINFIQLLDTQKIYLDLFNQSASDSQKKEQLSLVNSALSIKINSYEEHIKNQDSGILDSEIWFKDMTKYINGIKVFENKLLNEISELVDNRLKNDIEHLILWIIYISSIIIITLFIIYLFERSSKGQLYKLTDAMKYLADGGRDLRLKPTSLKDALSQMYEAYEITRQKLLHGDIYTELYQNQKNIELEKQRILNNKLENLAFIDPLTGCVNRRKFEEISNLELQRSSRYNNNLTLLMLDIDHFKSINDTYGHAVGDEVLKHFSSVCLKQARDMDVVARIGGEEFVVMLPHSDDNDAYIFAERFREQIYNSNLTIDEQIIKYSVSIGISTFDSQNDTNIAMILHKADLALYEAKNSGRNRCIVYKEQK